MTWKSTKHSVSLDVCVVIRHRRILKTDLAHSEKDGDHTYPPLVSGSGVMGNTPDKRGFIT